MARHRLSDRRVQTARARAKPYRLADGDSLYLYIASTGVKSWQFRYRLDGKQQTLTLGKLPPISLVEARKAADRARAGVAEGEQLTAVKRTEKLRRRFDTANTFDAVATAWVAREAKRQKWTPDYRGEVERSIRNHLSDLNGVPAAKLNTPMLGPVLRKVEARAPMMVEKVRRRLNAILDYAVEHGAIVGNPLPALRRGDKVVRRNYPAITDLSALGEVLRAARASDPCKGIQRAHTFLAFTGMRVSEVVGARWGEFALDGVDVPVGDGHRTKRDPNAGNWSIPRGRMKRKDVARGPHVVPLPPALLATLREWREADGAKALCVCPAPRDSTKPITAEAVEKHYRNVLGLSGKHSPHSWRSAFSTVCREAGKDTEAIEAQLDHVVGSKVASAYDRAKRLELRRGLMTWYEAVLIAARDGAKVVEIRRGA